MGVARFGKTFFQHNSKIGGSCVAFDYQLNQQQAAKLIGMTARFLRDHPECPRSEDDSYDAVKVVEWFVSFSAGDEARLKAEKLTEEIAVLKERNKKLQFENETTAGNMANIHRLRENLMGVMVPLQKVGEMFARKTGLTGPDAQQMLNKALEDYERLLGQQLSSDG